tara:strand:- start:960 stop:2555 length:1596 start_codon:yes stop_codon:yes gene_type:complete
MLIDTSGSMGARFSEDNEMKNYCMLDLAKILIMSFVSSSNKDDVLSLTSFDSSIKTICRNIKINSNEDVLGIMNTLEPKTVFRPSGTTSMFTALCTAVENIIQSKHSVVKNVIILLTDGLPSDLSVYSFISKFTEYHNSKGNVEFVLYTFSIGNGSNSKFLSDLSTQFGGTCVFVSDVGMAESTFINTLTNIKVPRCYIPNEKHIAVSSFFDNSITNLIDHCLKSHFEIAKDLFPDLENQLSSILYDDDMTSHQLSNLINEYLDQVKLATQPKYFNTWGKHYLYSLRNAHKRFECHTFVDKSVTIYIDLYPEEWDKTRDILEEQYNNIPILEPCYPVYGGAEFTSTTSIQQYASGNPCLHENSIVTLVGDKFKLCKDLQPNDEVIVFNDGKYEKDTIEYIIKTKTNANTKMVCVPNGPIITPWHPIFHDEKYIFPIELHPIKYTKEVGDYVYSFILKNRGESMIFDSTPALTLAHGIKHGIAKHDFWGTEEVLKSLNTYCTDLMLNQVVTLSNPFSVRDMDGKVISIMNMD